ADISDPAMILQQASNEARRDAHQSNRQCKAEYQNDRMLPRGTGDSENIVERHRYVSDDDLPGSLDESFARDMCGNRSIGVDIITCQCRGSLLPLFDGCPQLSPHLQHTQRRRSPPASRRPTSLRSCVVIPANTMRSAVAAPIPMRIAFVRCSCGKPAAAKPMTMALSPARTRSIMMTWKNAAMASLVRNPVMRRAPSVRAVREWPARLL